MKSKRIILHKNQVLYDIEGIAYKNSEVAGLETKEKNAISADHNETLDGRLLDRMMDTRDAQIRKRLRFCLAPTIADVSCDNPDGKQEYIYDLHLSDKFDDNMLNIVKVDMHDYLVKGVLLDWYKKMGVTPPVTDGELEEHLSSIVNTLRTPSYMKAPMQPFGPSKKFI